jgi:hypothetical protein
MRLSRAPRAGLRPIAAVNDAESHQLQPPEYSSGLKMKRVSTAVMVGALLALGGTAVVSTFLGDGDEEGGIAPREARRTTAPVESTEGLAARLTAEGVSGALYLTDETCRLTALRLPSLESASAPAWRQCEFSISPVDRRVAPGGTVWDPEGTVAANEEDGNIRLSSADPPKTITFPGAAPAYRPDGTLTFYEKGKIFAWTGRCLELPDDITSCRRPLLREGAITRQLGLGRRVSIQELAWLDEDSFVAIVGGPGLRNELVAIFEDGKLVNEPLGWSDPGLRDLIASPSGEYFAVLTQQFGPWIFDRTGRFVGQGVVPGAEEARKLAWSPDGRWLVISTPASIYIVNARDLELLLGGQQPTTVRLPVSARDIAWL